MSLRPAGKLLGTLAGDAVNRFPFAAGFVAASVPLAAGVVLLAARAFIGGGIITAIGLGLMAYVFQRSRRSRALAVPPPPPRGVLDSNALYDELEPQLGEIAALRAEEHAEQQRWS